MSRVARQQIDASATTYFYPEAETASGLALMATRRSTLLMTAAKHSS
jgi:hypothetical protein